MFLTALTRCGVVPAEKEFRVIKLRKRGRTTAATAVALTAALMVPGAAMASAQDEPGAETRLNVLYFNDFHGRIDNYGALTVGFAAKIEELRAAAGEENTVLLSGGDNIGGTLFNSSAQQDNPTIDILNAIDLDASVVGNHEFDAGIDDLEGRVADRKDFPYLAANVNRGGDEVADGGVFIIERNGVRIAVIGAVTEETPGLVDQGGIQGVTFTDPVDAVNEIAAEIEAADAADVVIAIYHEGANVALGVNAPQPEQAAALQTAMSETAVVDRIINDTHESVDVILNGHTHKHYNWLAPIGDDVRPVMQTGEYANNIGQIPLVIDADGNVSVDTEGFALFPTSGATIPEGNARVDAVASIVDEAIAVADEVGGQPIGQLEGDVTTAYTGGEFVDGVFTAVSDDASRDDRGNASAMGTLVANMYRDVLSDEQRGGADIGLVNPGGLRADFTVEATEDGVLTVRDAVSVLPFANSLFTTGLTGAQLKQTLEEQWQPEGSSRAYLQLGLSDNVRYTYDSTRERNDRITGIWIDGERVTDDQMIRVAIPSFLNTGTGDNFFTLGDGIGLRDGGVIDSSGFMDYVEASSPIAPDFARAQLDIVGLEPGAEFATGDQIAFTVNKVDLTSLGTPQTETLDVYLGEERIAQASVEANSAEVSFTVPTVAGAADAGDTVQLPLTLRSAASGTVIEVPVTVTADVVAAPTPPDSVETDASGASALMLLMFVFGAAVVSAAAVHRARQRA